MSDMLSQNGINPLTKATECDEKIATAKSLAVKGELHAIDILLTLEKKTRAGNDVESTRRILVSVVQLCFDAKEWDLLDENLIWLNQKRLQFVDAVTAMVKECITFIELTPNSKTKMRLIESLRIVTRDNPHLKIEYKQLTDQVLELLKHSTNTYRDLIDNKLKAKCDVKIAAAKSLVAKGQFKNALNKLLRLEKKTRTGWDIKSTTRVLVTIVQLCFDAKEWKLLNEHIDLLNKEPTQYTDAVDAMVKECITFVERTPNKKTKIKLIRTILKVTVDKPHFRLEHDQLRERLFQLQNDKTK